MSSRNLQSLIRKLLFSFRFINKIIWLSIYWILQEITNMFFDSLVNNSQVDDIAAKVVVNYIFGNNCAIDFNLFIERLKHQFENINRVIKDYFFSKILDKSLKLKVPTLDNPSYVLNQQLISLLSMSNPNFSNYDKMKLLYSNTDNALSFEKLALALISKFKRIFFF